MLHNMPPNDLQIHLLMHTAACDSHGEHLEQCTFSLGCTHQTVLLDKMSCEHAEQEAIEGIRLIRQAMPAHPHLQQYKEAMNL